MIKELSTNLYNAKKPIKKLTGAALTLLLGFLLLPIQVARCDIDENNDFKRAEITINGVQRVFFYHLPRGYRGTPTPVVFFFHGGGGSALSFASDIRFATRSNENDFIAVAPDGYEGHWNYGVTIRAEKHPQNDIEFSRQMIIFMETNYKVDRSKIYFGGFSEGAWFTQWATYQLPNVIAAAAAVCALEPVDWQTIYGTGHPTLPIAFMLGTSDPRMHWDGGITPNGTSIISANSTVWAWVKADNCVNNPSVTDFPERTRGDKSRVQLSYYRGAQNNDVAFYKVIGGGHAWPGAVRRTSDNGNVNEDIDATQMLWDFFKSHPKLTPNLPAPLSPS